jgi:hypothetical protein
MFIMTTDPARTLEACRNDAKILLKHLRSGEPRQRLVASRRFVQTFGEAPKADEAQLKHALALIAAERGAASWTAYKARVEAGLPSVDTARLFARGTGILLQPWCKTHAEAKAEQAKSGGTLFPYRRQYVLVGDDFLEALNLDPADPDWGRIGRDWVEPADGEAFERLSAKLAAAGFGAEPADAA